MKTIYDHTSLSCCKTVTRAYTTSFSLGIKFLHSKFRGPIYAIYSFFRLGDEIVDSFHDYPQAALLQEFQEATYRAIEEKISLNPILNAFQQVVNTYAIDQNLIEAFFASMEMDLTHTQHTQASLEKYLLGSSEIVGLMCLQVFCEKDDAQYQCLKPYAMRLGKAFQKINFLRDLRMDYQLLGRTYFPNIDFEQFTEQEKLRIQEDIADDLAAALEGIRQLPRAAKFGVYLAYVYYRELFDRICKTTTTKLWQQRVRIPNYHKYAMLLGTGVRCRLNLL